jgi:phage portal protein BeeE
MIYGGFQNWTKTVLLHGGLDYKTIGSNIEEFAYPQLRALTETHICSVFGVPPIVAGIQAGIDASTYSNYEQARKAFFEDTVQALWSRLDGALTRGLLSEFTDDRRIEP